MMTAEEKLIDHDLTELLSGETAPDLIDSTLARIQQGEPGDADQAGTELESVLTAGSEARPHPVGGGGRLIWLRRLATAACVLLAVGLMTWLLWPQSLPDTMTASEDASYLVRDDHVQLNQGHMLLTTGAPDVLVDDGRVSDLTGRAVVGAGIPQGEALIALADQLGLSAEETEMLKLRKRWLTAGGLALCLFSGQVMFNGEVVKSEDLPRPEISEQKIEIPGMDDVAGIKALMGDVTKARLRDLDDDYNWTPWLNADAPAEISGAIKTGLKRRVNGEPENELLNEFELTLRDGRAFEANLDPHGNLLRLSLPGWKDAPWYHFDSVQTVKLEDWLQRARDEQIEMPEHDDVEGLRKLIRSAEKVEVMIEDKRVMLTETIDVRRITEALTATGFATSDTALGWDPWDGVTMYLSDGRKIETSGLSWEEDVYDLRLPGWNRYYTYATPGGTHDVLRGYFEMAKNLSVDHRPFDVLRKWEGSDSEITEDRVEVILDQENWASVWQDHTINPADDPVNPPKLPDVDFASEMVVAVFGGKGINSRGYFVDHVLRAATGWIVRVDETTYQSMGGADDVTPYGIWVFPRSDWSVVVEENVQSLKNELPRWKQIGARIGTAREPENILDQWYPATTHTGTLSKGHGLKEGVRIVTDSDELDKITAAIGLDFEAPVDLDRNVVVFATTEAVKGTGNYFFELRGMNAGRLVARIVAPRGAQKPEESQLREIYGLWVLPRPNGELVIETPRNTRIDQPPTWQETVVKKMD